MKLHPAVITSVHSAAFCQADGMLSQRTHNQYQFSVPYGAPKAAGCAVALSTPQFQL
jgi:hypothetical protein